MSSADELAQLRSRGLASREIRRINEGMALERILALRNGEVGRAFLRPRLALLRAGTRLYRFNDLPHMVPGRDGFLSGWWSPTDPYAQDPGLAQRKHMARHFRVSLREYGRLTSAINECWGSLAWIIHAQLQRDVEAAFGEFASQTRVGAGDSKRDMAVEHRGAPARLPGGGTQFYLPQLRPADLRFLAPEAI
ncbi:MAG: hypothetical protein JSR54_13995 [Proteobacteria bacterium]|nr:hypothetical protein [Pseudomonadota bacterium]